MASCSASPPSPLRPVVISVVGTRRPQTVHAIQISGVDPVGANPSRAAPVVNAAVAGKPSADHAAASTGTKAVRAIARGAEPRNSLGAMIGRSR